MKLSEIASTINGKLVGEDTEVNVISSQDRQEIGSIAVISGKKDTGLSDGSAVCYVVGEEFPIKHNRTFIVVKDTRLAFAKLIALLRPPMYPRANISERASIALDVKIGSGIYVGDFAVIESGSEIGDNVYIYPHTYIGFNVSVGNGTVIYPNVTIYENSIIGSNVVIHAGSVIGADGFGFVPSSPRVKIPQRGRVRIGDNVELGANCTVDRGTVDDTLVGYDTKCDNMVHIAHNVNIGEHCLIAAQCGISGSTVIGDYVLIGGQVGIADHVQIAGLTNIAGKSGVSRDIKEKGNYGGIPVVDIRDWAKQIAAIKYLPELLKRVANLERKTGIASAEADESGI
jgi:UDP-3-O-[3-hydroxymyristoyl] glucosamine N-acyltransferase